MKKLITDICLVVIISFTFISCGQSEGYRSGSEAGSPQAVNKKTLVSMIKQLHNTLNVKNYSAEKGLNAIRPYLPNYKVCIPGFSKMVPYDESYVYVYCVYDAKTLPPKVLSFRFQLPKQLQQQLTEADIKELFAKWQLAGSVRDRDGNTSNTYKTGAENLSIEITEQPAHGKKESIVTQVIVYH